MNKRAKEIDTRKIKELQDKINDKRYINNAIDSLARVITRELLQLHGE